MGLSAYLVILGLFTVTRSNADVKYNKEIIEEETEDKTLIKFLSLLLSFGFDVNSKGSEDKTLAFKAAEDGELEILKVLLQKGADPNITGDFQELTPLQVASKKGMTDVVMFLVKQHIDIDAADNGGKTALFHAVEQEENDCVQILLSNGANPYIKGPNGMTVMHEAAYNGDTITIRELRKYTNLINDLDTDNKTPLYYAAYKNNLDSVTELVNTGADILPSVMWGAVGGGDADIVKYLVDKGGDVNARDGSYNDTVLMKAAINNNRDIIEFLLNRGAKIEEKNKNGYTALHWAASWDRRAAAGALINNNANLYATDGDGKTPADLAGPETKQLLLEAMKHSSKS